MLADDCEVFPPDPVSCLDDEVLIEEAFVSGAFDVEVCETTEVVETRVSTTREEVVPTTEDCLGPVVPWLEVCTAIEAVEEAGSEEVTRLDVLILSDEVA